MIEVSTHPLLRAIAQSVVSLSPHDGRQLGGAESLEGWEFRDLLAEGRELI